MRGGSGSGVGNVHGGPEPTGRRPRHKRVGVHHWPAGHIDQQRPVCHARDPVGVRTSPRLRRQRHRHDDDVGARQLACPAHRHRVPDSRPSRRAVLPTATTSHSNPPGAHRSRGRPRPADQQHPAVGQRPAPLMAPPTSDRSRAATSMPRWRRSSDRRPARQCWHRIPHRAAKAPPLAAAARRSRRLAGGERLHQLQPRHPQEQLGRWPRTPCRAGRKRGRQPGHGVVWETPPSRLPRHRAQPEPRPVRAASRAARSSGPTLALLPDGPRRSARAPRRRPWSCRSPAL